MSMKRGGRETRGEGILPNLCWHHSERSLPWKQCFKFVCNIYENPNFGKYFDGLHRFTFILVTSVWIWQEFWRLIPDCYTKVTLDSNTFFLWPLNALNVVYCHQPVMCNIDSVSGFEVKYWPLQCVGVCVSLSSHTDLWPYQCQFSQTIIKQSIVIIFIF